MFHFYVKIKNLEIIPLKILKTSMNEQKFLLRKQEIEKSSQENLRKFSKEFKIKKYTFFKLY
jgi:hypothetical protein